MGGRLLNLYFSQHFGVVPSVLEQYGAFDISVVSTRNPATASTYSWSCSKTPTSWYPSGRWISSTRRPNVVSSTTLDRSAANAGRVSGGSISQRHVGFPRTSSTPQGSVEGRDRRRAS